MNYFYNQNTFLNNLIDEFFDLIKTSLLQNNINISIILLGSLSRGEATWINKNEKQIIISDIEFFIVYDKKDLSFKKIEDVISKSRNIIFNEDNLSPLFHVDYTFIRSDYISKLEKKLLIFDGKIYGKTMFGEDFIDDLPTVTIKNINLIDIKDILIHRAFYVAYYGIPLKLSNDFVEYRYLLAKNSLDLMTVMLAINGYLVSGFRNKLIALKNISTPILYLDYFDFCLQIKYGTCVQNNKYTIKEMENMFIEISSFLYSEFRIKFTNVLVNIMHLIRRYLGILKRSFIYKKIIRHNFHKKLIYNIQRSIIISDSQKKESLVRNGYPK